MSTLATVAATIAPSVTPTPTVTPLVHVASQPGVLDSLSNLATHVSQSDMLVAAAILAVTIQYLLGKFRWVQDAENWVLSFILPFVVLIPVVPLEGLKTMKYGPLVYLVAQVAYFTVEKIKATARKIDVTTGV